MLPTANRHLLKRLENDLTCAPLRRLCCDPKWAADVAVDAGVYAIWDIRTEKPVYVGETSALLARMSDLGRTVNHTFRRIVRKRLKAESASEHELNAVLASRFELAFLRVPFGRAELEEYLILRWRRSLYNKPTLRLRKSNQYKWVEEAG
jgi:hypothetical protein